MDTYLCITQLNDFIFCPRSIYFHNIYQQNFDQNTYQRTWQKKGLAAHNCIEQQSYSSRKTILQGTTVYSEQYDLLGKIDTFDTVSGELTERKYSITAVYDGFRYQLFAQYYALSEMGYSVKSMKLYSSKNNKTYPVNIPGDVEKHCFENLLHDIRSFSLKPEFRQNQRKCVHCIYNRLCDYYQED